MQKINFQNLPSTATPINATNLNSLQDNVENAINGKVDASSLSAVATSGNYNDLTNKPTIPTNSSFTLNGLGEKNYDNLTNKPTIPTNTNQLTNGANFVTLGGVVNEGTNSNGYWIKFESGMMICTKTVSGSINIASGWGNGQTSNPIDLGSYAQTFTSTPVVQITPERGTGGYNYWLGASAGLTASSPGTITLLRFTAQNSTNYIINVIAIGKWK